MRNLLVLACLGLVLGCQSPQATNPSEPSKSKEQKLRRPSIDTLLAQFRTPNPDQVLVAAHRADWRNFPENSLPAIRSCIAMGVDLVELDVRPSADSQLVIFHDATLDRMTLSRGLLKDYPLDSLVKIPLLNGLRHETKYTIPTLEQALREAQDKILVKLDKCYDYLPQAYEVVQALEMQNQVIFISDKPYPEAKAEYGEVIDEVLLMPAFNCTWENIPEFVQEHIDQNDPVAFEIGFETEDCPSMQAFAQIKSQNIPLFIDVLWADLCAGHDDHRAVEDPEGAWGWVIEQGAHIVCTDRPAMLLEYLRRKKLHN